MKLSAALNVESMSNETLMLKVGRGDRTAFEQLYQKFKRPMMSYLYQMTRDASLAEDLTQDVFMRVYRAREGYEQTAKFSTWLWTIARNTAFDHFRKKKENLGMEDGVGDDIVDEAPLAEEIMVDGVDEKAIRDCLVALTPRAGEIVGLRIFSEESYEDIAQIVGVKVSQVKTILFRSKEKLIDCFKKKSRVE